MSLTQVSRKQAHYSSSAMSGHSSETKSPESEGPECFFACSDCSADSSHHRKVISHIFGRNKSCTTSIPISVWVHYCRKHYQRARYRADSQWALTQCDLAMRTIDNMESWGGVENFDVVLRRREINRRPESNERQARQHQQRQQTEPSPPLPEEFNLFDSPASLPLTIGQSVPMALNLSPVGTEAMGASALTNTPSMGNMVSQNGAYEVPSPTASEILPPRTMLQNGDSNPFLRRNNHLQSSTHFQYPQVDFPRLMADAAGFPFYTHHNHSTGSMEYGPIYHQTPYTTTNNRSLPSQFIPANAEGTFPTQSSSLLDSAHMHRQQPMLAFQGQQHLPETAPFPLHTEPLNVPPPLAQPTFPASQPNTRPSTSSSITTTPTSTRSRRKRAPTIHPHPVPAWLKGRTGPHQSFQSVKAILLNLRTYLERIKSRGQQPQFPDIEILPNLKPPKNSSNGTHGTTIPAARNSRRENYQLLQGQEHEEQEGREADAGRDGNGKFNGYTDDNIKIEGYVESHEHKYMT